MAYLDTLVPLGSDSGGAWQDVLKGGSGRGIDYSHCLVPELRKSINQLVDLAAIIMKAQKCITLGVIIAQY